MKFRSLIAAFALVAGLATQPAQAALVLFDDFNSETPAQGLSYTSFDNWTVTAGSVDLIGTPGFFDFYPGNGHYVDLNGSNYGQLTSNIVFGPGTYTLTFLLGGSTGGQGLVDTSTKTTLITLGDFNASIPLAFNAGLTSQSFTFTTATAGSLVFTSVAGGDSRVGNILDNVSLATAAPEPATWAMMLLGFAGVAFVAYRRSRRSADAIRAL